MKKLIFTITVSAALLMGALTVSAQGTAFTYQGKLTDNGQTPTADYDLQFTLYPSATGGSPVAGPVAITPVHVTDGIFTVPNLDFGSGKFTGADRWLEIGARPAGSPAAYTVMVPRQKLSPTPYAIAAGSLTGPVADSQLSANIPRLNSGSTFTGTAMFSPATGAPFAVGSNTKVNNLNADLLDGLDSAAFWKLAGNGGTSPGLDFLGTTDNTPLEIKVNNSRALRIEPNVNDAPNLLGGSLANSAKAGVAGGTISGGGATGYPEAITELGLGVISIRENQLESDFATIGGGAYNSISNSSHFATIAGGVFNVIATNSPDSTISGGYRNTIQSNAAFATISGGLSNSVTGAGAFVGGGGTDGGPLKQGNKASGAASTIVGGWGNIAKGAGSFVGGGGIVSQGFEYGPNEADGTASTIVGGVINYVRGDYSFIGGGIDNFILGTHSAVVGGAVNEIDSSPSYSFIGGGDHNFIRGTADHSTIGGGERNLINGFSHHSIIPGGLSNEVLNASCSFAAGRGAVATNDGTFVWADSSSSASFMSTHANQFLIRAAGGVGIGTASPLHPLHVLGTAKAENDSGPGIYGAGYFGVYGETMGIPYGRAVYGQAYSGADNVWGGLFRFGTDGNFSAYLGGNGAAAVFYGPVSVNGDLCYSGSFGTCSDERFKTNVQALRSALETVSQLRGVSYNWKISDFPNRHFNDRQQIGFIAQEVSKVLPQVVSKDNEGYYSVDYSRLTPVLVEAIKEQQQQIAFLKAELTEQKQTAIRTAARLSSIERTIDRLAHLSGPGAAGADGQAGGQ